MLGPTVIGGHGPGSSSPAYEPPNASTTPARPASLRSGPVTETQNFAGFITFEVGQGGPTITYGAVHTLQQAHISMSTNPSYTGLVTSSLINGVWTVTAKDPAVRIQVSGDGTAGLGFPAGWQDPKPERKNDTDSAHVLHDAATGESVAEAIEAVEAVLNDHEQRLEAVEADAGGPQDVVLSPVIASAADLTAAIADAALQAQVPGRKVILRLPAGALPLAAPYYVDNLDAPNLFIVGADAPVFGTGASTTLSAVADLGVVSNIREFDATFTNLTVPAGIAVGDIIGTEYNVLTGAPGSWATLTGCGEVKAVTPGAGGSIRLSCFVSSTDVIPSAGLPLTGANSVSFTFRKFGTTSGQQLWFRNCTLGGVSQIAGRAGMYWQGARLRFGFLGTLKSAASIQQMSDIRSHWPAGVPGSVHKGLYTSGTSIPVGILGLSLVDLRGLDNWSLTGGWWGGCLIEGSSHLYLPTKVSAGGIAANGAGVFLASMADVVGVVPAYTIRDSGAVGFYAIREARIDAAGSHASITCSPAANTIGNTNAYVRK